MKGYEAEICRWAPELALESMIYLTCHTVKAGITRQCFCGLSGCHVEYISFRDLVLIAFDCGKANILTNTKD